MVTTYDIAKRTGLNQSTVSRVLSGSTLVGSRTSQRVLAMCRQLRYVPNLQARGLKTQRTCALAVHMPQGSQTILADPFVPAFLSGVSLQASALGYSVVLSYPGAGAPAANPSLLVKSRLADGVIHTSPTRDDPVVASLIRNKIPFVTGRYDGKTGPLMVCVDIDNVHSGYQAGKFLVSRGHRTIGLVTESKESIVGQDFEKGFLRAMSEAGVRVPPERIKSVPVTFEAARQAAREMLSQNPCPTAIAVNTALTVFGALEAVRQAKMKVLVLGVASPLLTSLYPHLPRIQAPFEDLGRQMAGVLIETIRTGKAAATKMLYTKIIDRDETIFQEESKP